MAKITVSVGRANCLNMTTVWKSTLTTRTSCFRFASFVTSGQHFLEEEVKKYEDDPSAWMTSDSDGSDGEPDDRIDLHS